MATEDPRSTPTVPVSHPAFLISCALGVIGALLIGVGLVIGGTAIFDVGVFAGFASLVAALAWRADLVATWRREHPRTSNDPM